MSKFEQQCRQKLLDKDFYHYFQKRLTKLIGLIDGDMKREKDCKYPIVSTQTK